jgi:hypothetical protein
MNELFRTCSQIWGTVYLITPWTSFPMLRLFFKVSFVVDLPCQAYFPEVRYVVDWTIEPEVSDVGLKNEQTLMIFNTSTLTTQRRP